MPGLTAGFWMSTYWPVMSVGCTYWPDEYWTDYGTGAPPLEDVVKTDYYHYFMQVWFPFVQFF